MGDHSLSSFCIVYLSSLPYSWINVNRSILSIHQWLFLLKRGDREQTDDK